MTNFPNPYGIPDDEYYFRRYINDLTKIIPDIGLDELGGLTENIDSLFDNIELLLSSCLVTSVRSVLRGKFTNNSRVGPFENDGQTIVGIFLDYNSNRKLLAQCSVNNGITWTEVRTAALLNVDIISHDCHQVATNKSVIHVATQQSNGRVTYFTFSLTSLTWTLENEEVVVSAPTVATPAVSMLVLSGGDPYIFYEGDKELVSAITWQRILGKRRVAGIWGAAEQWGDFGLAISNIFGRGIPTNSNRIFLVFTRAPGTSSTPDYCVQVKKADGTKTLVSEFRATGALGGNPAFFLGDYCTYSDGINLILVVPVSFGGESTIFAFIDSDTVPTSSQEPVLGNFAAGNIVTRFINNELHILDWGWPSLGQPTFIRHKVGTTYAGPFSPSLMADQTGPVMPDINSVTQQMDGNFILRSCENVASLYVLDFVAIGSYNGQDSVIKYELIKVSDLPSSSSLTLQNWLDTLGSFVPTICC